MLIKDRKSFENFLTYKMADKDCWLSIDAIKERRSLSVNALYWVYLDRISQSEQNYSAPELHDIFKKMFLPPKFISYKGKEYETSPSTASLDKLAFQEYLMRIEAETQIPIPNPQEEGYVK